MGGNSESRGNYLAKNTAIFAIGSIATKLITFFLVPLYTNILTTAEYGVVDLVNTLSTVLGPILILNIYEAVLRFALDKGADYNKIMSIGLTILGGGLTVGLLIIPITSTIDGYGQYSVFIYFYVLSLAASLLFLSYLRGKEKLVLYSIGNVIHTLSIAVLNIIFLAVLHKGIKGYFTAYIIANAISVVFAYYAGNVRDVIWNFKWDSTLAKAMTKYSVVLIPNTFMWWITNSSDRVMVTTMISAAANGLYAVSYKLPSLVNTFFFLFNQAWNYSAIRENESVDRDQYNTQVYNGVVAVAVVSGVALMAIMKIFLKIYVGQEYFEAWRYTPYLIIGYVFLTLGTFLGTSYTVNKDSKGYLFSGTSGALINIVLNFALIPVIGISGAALATCTSYIVVYVYRCIDTKKYVRINILNKKHLISYFVMIIVAFLMFVDSVWGQLLMFSGLAIEVFLFKDIWSKLVAALIRKIRK